MKLEIGNFYVKDIVFGNELSLKDGVLTVNKEEALDFIRQDERITEAELYIAKPGDKIRMCPVKEAIEPRIRPDGRGIFPGYTDDLAPAGEGVVYALKNCSVLVVGRHWGGFQDGIIDMSGEGQKFTYFGQLNNIVLVADTNEDFEKHEQQKKNDALRRAGHKLAEYIAACVKELTPEDTEEEESLFPGYYANLIESGEDVSDPRLRRYLDLDRDYQAIAEEYQGIPAAREAFASCPGLRVLDQPPWEALFSFILSANNSGARKNKAPLPQAECDPGARNPNRTFRLHAK